jgi:GNAT superfamily N-acetyltransferase
MGLTPVPAGQLATVVTTLEMTARPLPAPLPSSPLRLVPWQNVSPERYRTLFRRIGEPWLWFSRLTLSDAELSAILDDTAVPLWAVCNPAGIEIGMLELDFRQPETCEIAFLGLAPEYAGHGHGRWLMAHALSLAWTKGISRVWLHSCTFDHPTALRFYQRAGFIPFETAVEVFPDPRLSGLLPLTAAPQIPLIKP